MNWTVDWGKLCDKVKKYITNAELTGEIIRVQGTKNKKAGGKGFNGRFTVKGLKPKKKKNKDQDKKITMRKEFDSVAIFQLLYSLLNSLNFSRGVIYEKG